MKRHRSVPFALFAALTLAWSMSAFATGNCANGKTIYYKKVGGVDISCSQSSCHKANLTGNNITNGANNPGLIDSQLDSEPEMNNLRGTLNLTFSDIDDIATFIFYYPSPCPSGGAPNLQAAPAPVVFASTTVGATSATTTVTITNTGTADALAVVASTGDATHFPISANTCSNVTVNVGGSCSFAVAFHPTVAGAASGTITVNRTGGSLTVGVSGTGTATGAPGVLSIPSSISFGSQTVGTTSSASNVTVTNTGGTAVNVSGVVSSNASEFTIASNSCGTVNPSASCTVGVTFKPSATGTRNATITVTSNGTGSPQTISASGTGASAGGPGQLSMNTSVSFGNQTVGSTSAATSVSVTNVGASAVSVSSVNSSNPSEFAVTNSTCATVNAGAGCSFSLTFTPGAAGARTAIISIVSNGSGSPQAVNASGTGVTGTAPVIVTVVEYRHSGFNHYFITPKADEIALLDAHPVPFELWARTGFSFKAYANAGAPAGSVAICRFFNSSFAPKSSHFYAPHGLGCETTIANFPDWVLEDDKLVNTMLPNLTNGTCPAGTIPVYRLYNAGMGGAPNHRFVTSLAERQTMLAAGYIAEGAGIGIGMCVPP